MKTTLFKASNNIPVTKLEEGVLYQDLKTGTVLFATPEYVVLFSPDGFKFCPEIRSARHFMNNDRTIIRLPRGSSLTLTQQE